MIPHHAIPCPAMSCQTIHTMCRHLYNAFLHPPHHAIARPALPCHAVHNIPCLSILYPFHPYRALPCHVTLSIPYTTIPCHAMSRHPYHTLPYYNPSIHALPCHVTPFIHTMPCDATHTMPYRALPCHVPLSIPYTTIPHHVMHITPHHATPFPALQCHTFHTIQSYTTTISHHTVPCHAMSHTIPYLFIPYNHTLPYHVMSCHTIIPYHTNTIPYPSIPNQITPCHSNTSHLTSPFSPNMTPTSLRGTCTF